MKNIMRLSLVTSIALILLSSSDILHAQQGNMTFFVTSVGSGKGADLGGLSVTACSTVSLLID